MFQNRSTTLLALVMLKFLVGGIACIEVIVFSLNMSYIMKILAADWTEQPGKWFLVYMTFIIALYMALPIAMGLLVARSKIAPNNNSLLWSLFILPARFVTLAFLAIKLDSFHYMMIPHILSIITISIYYAFAFKTKLMNKDGLGVESMNLSETRKSVESQLPPPVMIAEIQVDVNALHDKK